MCCLLHFLVNTQTYWGESQILYLSVMWLHFVTTNLYMQTCSMYCCILPLSFKRLKCQAVGGLDKRILIIDSDRRTSKSFSDVFNMEGYQVSVAHNPLQAREMLQNNSFDCILMSFSHPDTIGRDLLVFSRNSMPNALTIVVNDFPNVESAIKAIDCGSDAIFAKPVNMNLLLDVVHEKIVTQS